LLINNLNRSVSKFASESVPFQQRDIFAAFTTDIKTFALKNKTLIFKLKAYSNGTPFCFVT